MRIWDINPGYLNRQSLLGEHRELHGIVSIIVNAKKGYSNHPETVRWQDCGWALNLRHKQLACEMALRGYVDKSPVTTDSNKGHWPLTYIDTPAVQFKLLEDKYRNKEKGRIPLPGNEQQLWRQHKYSVLARDPDQYKELGRYTSCKQIDFPELSLMLTEILRTPPKHGGIRNAVQHMWGYVSDQSEQSNSAVDEWSLQTLLIMTQKNALARDESYLIQSTALSELMVWL